MTQQGMPLFTGASFWLLLIAATAFAIYLGARLARIEGNSVWRAFFAALTSAFATLIVVSMSQDSLRRSLFYWIGIFAVIAALVIKPALRTTVWKAAVPWLLASLMVAVGLLAWHLFFGVPLELRGHVLNSFFLA
jgi:hypothetical protein